MSPTISQTLAESGLDPVDARALLRHALNVDAAFLIAHAGQALTRDQCERFSALAARRRAGEPVAYISGTREFFSLDFTVTPAVLIPRPETELLVEFALERIAPDGAARVLDLATGSGCIAISIAHHRPRAQIIGVDNSAEALAVARANAERLLGQLAATPSPSMGEGRDGGDAGTMRESRGATPNHPRSTEIPGSMENSARVRAQAETDLNVQFMHSDWFCALAGRRFDLIVSNPPYVAVGDPHLAQGDLRFEPSAALAAGADGLDCIRRIIAAAPQHLNCGGWLAFEHGHDQASRCRELLAAAGYAQVFSRRDLSGIERISGARRERPS